MLWLMKLDGNRIADARKAKRLSQIELATEVGCSPATIARIEQGTAGDGVAFGTVYLIASTLDVAMDSIVDEDGCEATA